jgi:carboxyl-terminal processing protease
MSERLAARSLAHPLLPLCSVAVLLLASSGLAVSAARSTVPAPTPAFGKRRLYVGLDARLTAEMPADWLPDPSLSYDYVGPRGYISSLALHFPVTESRSLDAAATLAADHAAFGHQGEVTTTTWRERPARIVRAAADQSNGPIALVVEYPEPEADGQKAYVAVIVDADHFSAVTDSISFDMSAVTPANLLDAIIDFMQTHSLWRASLDWVAVRAEAHALLGDQADDTSLSAADPAIEFLLGRLRAAGADYHNLLRTPAQAATASPSPYIAPSGMPLAGGFGYVIVPGFQGEAQQASLFASEIAAVIASQQHQASCGWIVDLRQNTGGNMYPMLSGLAPLLGPGTVAEFRSVTGAMDQVALGADGSITYLNAGRGSGSFDYFPAVTLPDTARLASLPIAVLIGGRTASAGEAVTIAFARRANTHFFGESTAGFATSPTWLPLLNESLLALATMWTTGPLGAIYPQGIQPDVEARPANVVFDPLDRDPVVQAALAWLQGQPGSQLTLETSAT